MVPLDPSFCDRSPQRLRSLLWAMELALGPCFLADSSGVSTAVWDPDELPKLYSRKNKKVRERLSEERQVAASALRYRMGADPFKRVCSILP